MGRFQVRDCIELLAAENAAIGESPLWDSHRQILYWTDIPSGKFWQYDPTTGTNLQIHEGRPVAGMALNSTKGLVIGTAEGVQLWKSDDEWQWLFHGSVEGHRLMLNDVIAGPDGSLIGGSGGLDSCTVFRFHPDGSAEIIDEGIGLCNGMGFSPDLSSFYSTDTVAGEIYRWDYNHDSGEFRNKRVFARVDNVLGVPDGLTVDAEGFVWSAIWYGATVLRFDPEGKEERRINFPARQTSCPMFGGRDLNELYVTTASVGTGSETRVWREPDGYDLKAHRGGELYRVTLDIQGKNEFRTGFVAGLIRVDS